MAHFLLDFHIGPIVDEHVELGPLFVRQELLQWKQVVLAKVDQVYDNVQHAGFLHRCQLRPILLIGLPYQSALVLDTLFSRDDFHLAYLQHVLLVLDGFFVHFDLKDLEDASNEFFELNDHLPDVTIYLALAEETEILDVEDTPDGSRLG